VLTDYVYYAMVYDVIVAEARRDEGLVPFYEDCGFEVMDGNIEHLDGDPEPLSWMVHRREEE